MREATGKDISTDSELYISAKGLQGKQSVRATFNLPEHVIKLLGIVAAQLGLKQKSLFDQLIEDKDILNKVAENAADIAPGSAERRQKTFVLSRRSLDVLIAVARQRNISRDLLVEISIQRLLPVVNDEREKHGKRVCIHKELEILLNQGKKLLRKADRLLGKEDPTYELVKKIVETSEENIVELRAIIEKGQAMKDIEP